MRVFLTGNVRIETDSQVLGTERFPGRQGRLLFAYLVLDLQRPVPRDELADLLWGQSLPATWDKALAVLVSKLRVVLTETGCAPDALTNAFGCYQLRLPDDAWVDVAAAKARLADAGQARDAGDLTAAREAAAEAAQLAREAFLPGDHGEWVEARRADQRQLLLRSLDCLAEVALADGQAAMAVAAAEEACVLEPFRETGHQQLMLAHAASGNRAEALRAFDRCRRLLDEELGVAPAYETEAVYLDILRGPPPVATKVATAEPPIPTSSAARSGTPSAQARTSRRTAVAAGLALALVAGGGVVLAMRGPAASTAVPPSSLAAFDIRDGHRRTVAPLPGLPGDMVSAGGALWVAVPADGTVIKVDPRDGRVVKTVVVDPALSHLATDGQQVWFSTTTGGVGRIDPQFATVRRLAAVPPLDLELSKEDRPLAYGAGALWLVDPGGLIVRIDPATGRTNPPIQVGAGVSGLAVGTGGVWAANGWDGTVSHVDETGAVGATTPVGKQPASVALTAAAVWVTDRLANRVVRIDPSSSAVEATVAVSGAPGAVLADTHDVWVAGSDGSLTRIDPRTDRVTRRLRLGSRPVSLAGTPGRLWVATGPATVLAATARGGVLRMDLAADVTSLDPLFVSQGAGIQLAYATCEGLLAYAPEPGRAGFALVPALADAVPQPGEGGLVYRFRVRDGRQFAPPSAEPITAATFAHVIERALDPRAQAPAGALLPEIQGASAFQAQRAAHVAGLEVDGSALVVRLARPSSRLLRVLAMPEFCAVPLDTPADPRGAPSVPATGPYLVSIFAPGSSIVLRRNPSYDGLRPARFTEIDVAVGQSPEASLRRLLHGQTDYVAGGLPSTERTAVAARWGAGSPAALRGRQRYFSTPGFGVRYVMLNAARPLFADPSVRRAVSYAVDRPLLARQQQRFFQVDSLVGGPAVDGLVPPQLPDVAGAAVYPLTGPDLVTARRLMRGRRAAAVMYTCTASPCPEQAAVLKADLARIGITVEVRAFPKPVMFQKLFEPNAGDDLSLVGIGGDYGGVGTFYGALVGAGSFTHLALPEQQLPQGEPGAALDAAEAQFVRMLNARWAPAVAYSQDHVEDLFSDRIGCQLFQPLFGMDLGSLCLR